MAKDLISFFQEFVFEIVVDKKLVPKEVLETGGNIRPNNTGVVQKPIFIIFN